MLSFGAVFFLLMKESKKILHVKMEFNSKVRLLSVTIWKSLKRSVLPKPMKFMHLTLANNLKIKELKHSSQTQKCSTL